MIRKYLKDIRFRPVLVFLILYLPLILISYLFEWLDGELPIEILRVKLIVLCLSAGLLGLSRIGGHHPGCDQRYLKWLILTPWEFGKSLPRGAMFMNFSDGLLLAVLTLLAFFNDNFLTISPLITYMGIYTLIAMAHLLAAKKFVYINAFLFILPFAIYPHNNINITFLVVAVLYGLACVGTIGWLKEFPWNTSIWNYDQRKKLLDVALKGDVLSGPYKSLRGVDLESGVSRSSALTVCLLLTWWFHIASWVNVDIFIIAYPAFLLGAVLVRIGAYTLRCKPPITYIARLFTGNFIIPGYDKVMLAPLCITLVGMLMPVVLKLLGLGLILSFEISFFSFLMLAFTMSPSLKQWHLTGSHSIFIPPRSLRDISE
jgi:hypothetical protein